MQIRSYDDLDFPLAWRRVLSWAQGGGIDLPDRLPFEVLSRLYGSDGPRPAPEHHLSPITLVMSSKKSGTARPFTRLNSLDLTLYQALVDKLAPDIERALPARDTVFAARQSLGNETRAFAGTPGRAHFQDRIQTIFSSASRRHRYAITADVAGYFLHVRIDELEHRIYAASSQVAVVRDLIDLLRGWQLLGVEGLPQGVQASRPLGNLYLLPVDTLLASRRIAYVPWIDDWVIAAPGFHPAREIQDEVEKCLYGIGLTLAADKTGIVRATTAVEDSVDAKARLARIKRARQQASQDALAEALAFSEYPPDEEDLPDPGELDLEATVEHYETLLATLENDDLPRGFRPMVTEILRDLGSVRHAHALDRISRLLERAPDLTGAATRYLATVAQGALGEVETIFSDLLDADRFSREYEKLELCHSALSLPMRRAPKLARPFGEWALEDPHELVRARALLAWGAQSAKNDFSAADAFWVRGTSAWRPYALVAIQSKDRAARNRRYDKWSGDGRFLGRLARALKSNNFGWRKL